MNKVHCTVRTNMRHTGLPNSGRGVGQTVLNKPYQRLGLFYAPAVSVFSINTLHLLFSPPYFSSLMSTALRSDLLPEARSVWAIGKEALVQARSSPEGLD